MNTPKQQTILDYVRKHGQITTKRRLLFCTLYNPQQSEVRMSNIDFTTIKDTKNFIKNEIL